MSSRSHRRGSVLAIASTVIALASPGFEIRTQRGLTLSTTFEIAEGLMYFSPPKFLPGLPERYRPTK